MTEGNYNDIILCMEAHEAYKDLRVKTGYNILDFAKKAGISFGSEHIYESGERSLLLMTVDNAISVFNVFDYDVETFFYRYFPEIKTEVDEQIRQRDNWYVINKKKYHLKLRSDESDRHPSIDHIYTLLYESNLRMQDLSTILQVSKQSIYTCRRDAKYSSMRIGTALKICYLFNKHLLDIFYSQNT